MEKRTSFMLAYDILQVAIGGATKTQLVYRGNLNFYTIKKWLSRLISKNLIEFHSGHRRIWTTTAKGIRFMSAMDRVLEEWDDGPIRLDEMAQEIV